MRAVDTLPAARIDFELTYEGYQGCDSACRLRVYTSTEGVPVLVLSERETNPGTSITNAAERCQWLAWARIGKPWPCRFVEHYPGRAPGTFPEALGAEHADEVFFAGTSGDGPCVENGWMIAGRGLPAFVGPVWKHLPLAEFLRLVGAE